jgi:hypothetical protein
MASTATFWRVGGWLNKEVSERSIGYGSGQRWFGTHLVGSELYGHGFQLVSVLNVGETMKGVPGADEDLAICGNGYGLSCACGHSGEGGLNVL